VKRYVEHVMGMPISLALRGRHTDDALAAQAWATAFALGPDGPAWLHARPNRTGLAILVDGTRQIIGQTDRLSSRSR
jgi:hypothetical protein